MKKAILIDYKYCTGCHTCEVACQQEHGYAAGQFGIKVTEHILERPNGLMIDYVPYMTDLCNFCLGRVEEGRKPSCVKHCLSNCMVFGEADEIVEEAKKSKKPVVFFK